MRPLWTALVVALAVASARAADQCSVAPGSSGECGGEPVHGDDDPLLSHASRLLREGDWANARLALQDVLVETHNAPRAMMLMADIEAAEQAAASVTVIAGNSSAVGEGEGEEAVVGELDVRDIVTPPVSMSCDASDSSGVCGDDAHGGAVCGDVSGSHEGSCGVDGATTVSEPESTSDASGDTNGVSGDGISLSVVAAFSSEGVKACCDVAAACCCVALFPPFPPSLSLTSFCWSNVCDRHI
jgi:hypothetical protein